LKEAEAQVQNASREVTLLNDKLKRITGEKEGLF
jgi:hypothetical protein